MKRLWATAAALLSAGACVSVALAPTASAVPPKQWHPCSDYFRDVTDPQAWNGARYQPIISPWGNTNITCAWEWFDGPDGGSRVGWLDAYQVDPAGVPHAMMQVGISGETTLWITNPF